MTIYHTAFDRTPYTYLIGWTSHNKWYYGVRYGKNCHPSDLWVSYFTSSKHVKQFRDFYGEPDIITIRKVFEYVDKARYWEQRVLQKLKIIYSEKWLNHFDGISISVEAAMKGAKTKGKNTAKWSEERKNTLSELATKLNFQNRLMSEEANEKRKNTLILKFQSLSKEERQKMTSSMNTDEVRTKAMETFKETIANRSEERKEEIKINMQIGHANSSYDASLDIVRNEKIRKSKMDNNPSFTNKIDCPFCNKSGQYSAMKRWHFENCKYK